MKHWHKLILCLPLIVILLAWIFSNPKNLTCKVYYRKDIDIKIHSKIIKAEEAKTPAQQEKGLGARECIAANQGMLFELKQSGYYPFWMKGMNFPIDMVWINTKHQAVTIKPNVMPSSYPKTFMNDSPAKYVLELRAGQAAKLNIKNGTPINF